MKEGQAIRLKTEISQIEKRSADIQKKISQKKSRLLNYNSQLKQEREREKRLEANLEKRINERELSIQREITAELLRQREISRDAILDSTHTKTYDVQYDFFISHANEDKEPFVRSLAEKLQEAGAKVWYDAFVLKIGDSLRIEISKGLNKSRYGIVVLSESFFRKTWTNRELSGLMEIETLTKKVILPIWHKVTRDEVVAYDPILADKKALNTSIESLDQIVEELMTMLD
ncbi:MAG: toll/interleukin-1 receptor domain-containing protein [Algoriphagus sp.]|nr:toll/interleukin-1 receptor domain-containing protein [Algoriphagus sp.]